MARNGVRPFGSRRFALLLAAMTLLSLASCVTPPPGRETPVGVTPPLRAHDLLAPVDGDGSAELARLSSDATSHAARLRRAYILLNTGTPHEAIRIANELLFGANPPSPGVDAFAYFVRGEAYARLRDDERATHDRNRAAELALDPDLRARVERVASAPVDPVAATTGGAVHRLARSAWRARPADPRNLDPMGRVFRVTIHHSAILARESSSQAAATAIQSIQRQHMNERGYGDIGYHYLIDRAGRVWHGRDLRWQGAHAAGSNNVGNLGICLLGNFIARDGQKPTPAQIATLTSLLRDVTHRYSIPPNQIHTHKEMKATDCPGEHLQAVVDSLRRSWRSVAAGATPSGVDGPVPAARYAAPR